MKINSFLKTFSLFLISGIFFIACNRGEIEQKESIENFSINSNKINAIKKISFSDMIKTIPSGTVREDLKFYAKSLNGKGLEDYVIDTTLVKQIQYNEIGYSYTMKIIPISEYNPEEELYNLTISEFNGEVEQKIIKYDLADGKVVIDDSHAEVVYDTNKIRCQMYLEPCEYGYYHDDDVCIGTGQHIVISCTGTSDTTGGNPDTNGPTTPTGHDLDGNGGGSGGYPYEYFNSLTNQQISWLNSNGYISQNLQSYIQTHGSSTQILNFVKWAVNFFMQNPSITWEQFDAQFVKLPPPITPITDIVQFLSCFDIHQSANLTVYALKMFGGNGVGHAFISIKQGNNVRTFGFYPKLPFPSNTNGPGVFGNDSGHAFTYGWNAGTITPTQLQQIIADSYAFSNSDYNVLMNNCSDFANYVLQIAGQNCNASGVDTPNTIADLISNISQYTNGNAP